MARQSSSEREAPLRSSLRFLRFRRNTACASSFGHSLLNISCTLLLIHRSATACSRSAPTFRILAANRDEFLSRPTTSAAFHAFESTDLSQTPDAAHPVLSGLDLEGGGTWLGVSLPDAFPSSGTGERLRFATLTNFTETIAVGKRPSRGALVKDWLYGRVEEGMSGYLDRVEQRKEEYAGFNLLLGSVGRDGKWEMGYVSNRGEEKARKVEMPRQGSATGLSNATLGEVQGGQRWPKVQQGCQAVEKAIKVAEEETQLVAKLWDVLRWVLGLDFGED